MEDITKEEPQKRLTEAQWIVACSLWERGEVTLKELTRQFDISEPALSQGFKRRGIKRGSKAHLAYKEIESKQREEKEKMVEDIYHFKKKFLRYGDFLMTLTMNEITDAKKKNEKLFSRKNEIETIIAATKVYKTIRNDMYHLYDLYNPDNKQEAETEFNIGVYSERELETLREAQELMDQQLKADNNEAENGFNFQEFEEGFEIEESDGDD